MANKEIHRQYITKKKRALRVRRDLHGSSARPRLCVVKTNKHIIVQLIDDDKGVTLSGIGTNSKEYAKTEFCKKNKQSARKLGEKIAEMAKQQDIKEVIFDRGPFKFHGILAELANAARAGGLRF